MGSVSRFLELGCSERLLLIRAAALLLVQAAALRVRGVRAALERSAAPATAGSTIGSPDRIAYLVDAAANRLPGTARRCLARSLVLHRLLSERGHACELRIGVRLDEANLDAHAWIELGGKPLNAVHEVRARYLPFDRVPARRP
ncbi:MAG TPA: lasso peptide biosynthesis B2 protein [Usitatibacter sp.]|nr:lasso peptide biosynthesis B2 protein [Usitatibacter sp.]